MAVYSRWRYTSLRRTCTGYTAAMQSYEVARLQDADSLTGAELYWPGNEDTRPGRGDDGRGCITFTGWWEKGGVLLWPLPLLRIIWSVCTIQRLEHYLPVKYRTVGCPRSLTATVTSTLIGGALTCRLFISMLIVFASSKRENHLSFRAIMFSSL